jgi:hypothetical protein
MGNESKIARHAARPPLELRGFQLTRLASAA